MLTAKHIDDAPISIEDEFQHAEMVVLQSIAKSIKVLASTDNETEYQVALIQERKRHSNYASRVLNVAYNNSIKILSRITKQTAAYSLDIDNKIYTKHGLKPLDVFKDREQQLIMQSVYSDMAEGLQSIKTNAIKKSNVLFLETNRKVKQDQDSNDNLAFIVPNLADDGLKAEYINTKSNQSIDSSINTLIGTSLNILSAEMQLHQMDKMNVELIETTAHLGARPTHSIWQGKVFMRNGSNEKYANFYHATGYGTIEGLCGVNCHHGFYPYYEGDDRAYTQEILDEWNNKTVVYDGQEMSYYDATQKQRYLERQVRKWKIRKELSNELGVDSLKEVRKVKEWQSTLNDFTKQTGLRRRYYREQAA